MFDFYKFIQPDWFNFLPVKKEKAPVYFPDYDFLPCAIKEMFPLDSRYVSVEAAKWDVAFVLYKKGFNIDEKYLIPPLAYGSALSVRDNYIFVKKYFGQQWCLTIFLIRLFLLCNPIKEFSGLIKSIPIPRVLLYDSFFEYMEIDTSFSCCYQPSVSVILPTLDRYDFLGQALKGLERQTNPILEVIVIDQSEAFKPEFYQKFDLPLRVIRQEKKGQWTARNLGVQLALGDVFAFYEDDVQVESNWLEEHLKVLACFNADISAGVVCNGSLPIHKSAYTYADQFASGNVVVKRKVFEAIGLFDLNFDLMRWGDSEFGLRAYLAGFKSVSNPKAYCIDLKSPLGGLRSAGSWNGYKPVRFFGVRPMPSVTYYFKKYFPERHLWASLLINLPLSYIPRICQNFKWRFGIGFMMMLLFFPVVLMNLIKSCRKASSLLKKGGKIEMTKLDTITC
jgi:glycosyltransferase involved in cell wall biosynthesis